MKDFNGNEIEVGDTVAYIETGYRNFKRANVVKITAQKVSLGDTMRFGDEVIVIKKGIKEIVPELEVLINDDAPEVSGDFWRD